MSISQSFKGIFTSGTTLSKRETDMQVIDYHFHFVIKQLLSYWMYIWQIFFLFLSYAMFKYKFKNKLKKKQNKIEWSLYVFYLRFEFQRVFLYFVCFVFSFSFLKKTLVVGVSFKIFVCFFISLACPLSLYKKHFPLHIPLNCF